MEKRSGTGKTILKTSLMTLLGLLLAGVIVVCSLCFAIPGTMSAVAGGLGMRHFACYLSEAQYEKTRDVADLGTVLARAEFAADYGRVETYSEKLLSHPEFDAFAAYQNAAIADDPAYAGAARPEYRNYVQGNYVYALYRVGKRSEALEKAASFLPESAHYGTNNPLTRFIGAYCEDPAPEASYEELDAILAARYDAALAAYGEAPDAYRQDMKELCMDRYLVAKKAGDAVSAARWAEEFKRYLPGA